MSHPVSGTEIPFETANDVITQVPWFALTPRLPAIVGSDTFAIVVSSTCMNVPRPSANAVSPRVPGGSGMSGRSCVAPGPVIPASAGAPSLPR